jgi:hypothetical protein
LSDGVQSFSVGMAVRLYPGTEREKLGHVVEDFGETAGRGVDRCWAVVLDDGGLVFADSDQLVAA